MNNKVSFDQSDDFSQVELYRFLKDTTLPEIVKQSMTDDIVTLEGLPKTAFADEMHRAYPLNTPARAFVSHVYFTQKRAGLETEFGKHYTEKIAEKLDTALKLFNLDKEAAEYTKQAMEKAAEDYQPKSISVAIADGCEIELYTIKTANDLVAAAEDFNKNIKTIPMDWRFKIASDIVKLAKEFKVDDVPDLICKYAGMFYPDIDSIKKELWRRSTKTASADTKKVYQALIDDCQNIMSKDEVRKLAETVYYIEKMEGAYDKPKVAELLPDPIDMFFSVPIEKIAEDLDVVKMGGEIFKVEDLKKVSADIYEQAFGFSPDFKTSEAKDALETVPRSDVVLFKELSGLRSI